LEISEDGSKPKSNMPSDILQKDEGRTYLFDNSMNVGPQVPWIVLATSRSGLRERLAGIPRSDEIHRSTPRLAVEGSEI